MLEEFYFLQKNLGMAYRDVYVMPVTYRKWYIDKFISDVESRNKKISEAKGNFEMSSPTSFAKKFT